MRAVVTAPKKDWIEIAQDWQGLEAGALAIIAAIIGLIALNRQTRQNALIEQDRIARQLRARRAVLPLTLSALSDWANSCGLILLDAMKKIASQSVFTSDGEMPELPGNLVRDLERFVEACDESGAASISNLLGDIQIFDARMRSAGFIASGQKTRHQASSDVESHLIGIATIAAHIASLFEYGRRMSETTIERPTWEDVRTALRLIGADADFQPNLFKRVNGREKVGKKTGYLAESNG